MEKTARYAMSGTGSPRIASSRPGSDSLDTDPAREKSTIDNDRVPVRVARRGAHEVDCGADELFGLAESPLRGVGFEELSARRAFDQLAVQICRENTGRDSVYSNAILRPLVCKA